MSTGQDTLTAWVQRFYAQAVSPPETQMAASKRLQGAAYDANLDANHPLQSWAKRLTDAISNDAQNVDSTGATAGTTPTQPNAKWKTYIPVVLLVGAVWLIFTEA